MILVAGECVLTTLKYFLQPISPCIVKKFYWIYLFIEHPFASNRNVFSQLQKIISQPISPCTFQRFYWIWIFFKHPFESWWYPLSNDISFLVENETISLYMLNSSIPWFSYCFIVIFSYLQLKKWNIQLELDKI